VFSPIVRGIARTLASAGYVAVLSDSDNDMLNAKAIVDSLLARQVDGLILATALREDPIVDDGIETDVPVALVSCTAENACVASVSTDDDTGIRLAVQHLVELGHRQIAFVGGPQITSTGDVR
jgi:LacI family transcriptional regulator